MMGAKPNKFLAFAVLQIALFHMNKSIICISSLRSTNIPRRTDTMKSIGSYTTTNLVISPDETMQSASKDESFREYRSRGSSSIDSKIKKDSFSATATISAKETSSKNNKIIAFHRDNFINFPYESTLRALKVYHSKHGHLAMPRRYIIPADEGYPSEWHGADLPSTIYNMNWWGKHVKQRPDRVSELNKIGFVWERLQPQWNLVLEALVTYLSLHGNILVPQKFVVPYGDKTWPTATWGIPLGNVVYRIRARNDFLSGDHAVSRQDQLEGLGFVWDVREYKFRKFVAALQHFAYNQRSNTAYRGLLKVPSNFIVPSNDETWPKELWGYQLGAKCSAVRQKELYIKNNPDRRKLLEDLGFLWSGNASLGWHKVVHASAIYCKLYQKNLDVKYQFVVPAPPEVANDGNHHHRFLGNDDIWPWPEYLWGLPLGQRLKDIRVKGAYLTDPETAPSRKRQLDAMGFNWNPKRGCPKQ